jgi:outer membrane protein TolC
VLVLDEWGTAPLNPIEAAVLEALSLERAVSLALASSREVRQAERGLEQAQMQKDDAWYAYGVILALMYNGETGTYTPLPKGSDPTPAVYQTYYVWKQAQRQVEAIKETVVRPVYGKYYSITRCCRLLPAWS